MSPKKSQHAHLHDENEHDEHDHDAHSHDGNEHDEHDHRAHSHNENEQTSLIPHNHHYHKKALFSKIVNWIVFIGYPPAYAVTNAFVIYEFMQFILHNPSAPGPGSESESEQKPQHERISRLAHEIGFYVALITAIPQSVAMMYYQNKRDKAKSDQHAAHGHSHGSHNWKHAFEHFIGLQLYNFCFGFGGAYFYLMEDKIPENTQEMIYVTAFCTVVGLLISAGETKIHEFFEDIVHKDHGSIFTALKSCSGAFLRKGSFRAGLKSFWINYGIFFSHASAGLFGCTAAINALGLLYFGKIPENNEYYYITLPIAASLGLVGSTAHTVTELESYERSRDFHSVWESIQQSILKNYFKVFLASSIFFMGFHALPESIAIPEIFPDDMIPEEMWGRIGIAVTFIMALGIPDIITYIPLVLGAVVEWCLDAEAQNFPSIGACICVGLSVIGQCFGNKAVIEEDVEAHTSIVAKPIIRSTSHSNSKHNTNEDELNNNQKANTCCPCFA